MELKQYQRRVLENIRSYAEKYVALGNATAAYDAYLANDGLVPGKDGVPRYHDRLHGVPDVCVKVPTGGGKTFIAANAVGVLSDELPDVPADAVVWLVPRKEILTQTLRQLGDPTSFLRMTLDRDFAHSVEVLDKEDGLRGRGFTRDTVEDQLTLFVLSYDSFKNKEGRRAFAENSSLMPLTSYQRMTHQAVNVEGADDTALISALAATNPIVIVDESHHAASKLSEEMLQNLNPRFVLELTATPRKESNVICRVRASELKEEGMVKLPVIVYRRDGRDAVVQDAVLLQRRLEQAAVEAEERGGDYIRPIVLFQAEKRGREEARDTYEKLREALIGIGTPEEQIAVRTGDVDEIKGRDLMDHGCPVRFVITVEALAEGWDCPFAYVLASVANKGSKVSVEQIVGRILRQPYAQRSQARCLNISYVLTSSADFEATLDQVIAGLNGSGFSSRDVVEGVTNNPTASSMGFGRDQSGATAAGGVLDDEEFQLFPVDLFQATGDPAPYQPFEPGHDVQNPSTVVEGMINEAEVLEQKMEEKVAQGTDHVPGASTGIGNGSNVHDLRSDIADQVKELRLPMYRIKEDAGLFSMGDTQPFDRTNFLSRLDLSTCATTGVHLNPAELDDARQIDIDSETDEFKARHLSQVDADRLRELFASLGDESRRKSVRDGIIERLTSQFRNTYGTEGLQDFVGRVVASMSDAEVMAYVDNARRYANAVAAAIRLEADDWCKREFEKQADVGSVLLEPCYGFPEKYVPRNATTRYDRTLYTAEDGSMNGLEKKMADFLANQENILWWHRVVENRDGEFHINGFINHYPDFLAETVGGTILAIETKGEHLKNDDSADKLHLGRRWADSASSPTGRKYRYFMVFENDPISETGAYDLNDFKARIRDMA
ncbi:DEAD/DEAH box helicase family protein [Atopobiaceae bacterium FL090493]|nr:DEAD/DEAH box helicase family protein [Atopobiaceae bacterium FL090493]